MATKTKDLIVNSFLKLMCSEDFDKITVTELVNNCQISRQTFYYHFDDIEKMLEWAFQKETKLICKRAQSYTNWLDAALGYVDFLERYELLLKKSMNSSKFILIYNLLYKSFFDFTSFFVSRKPKFKEVLGKNAEFIVECSASSFVGLIILTIQKDNPDYNALIRKINLSTTGLCSMR